MPVSVKLGPIFDKAKLTQALSNAVTKTLVEYAEYVRTEQKESQPSGKVYRRKGGKGFRRSHRASAKGQRPAIDSGKLLNSTKHKKTGQLKGEVTTIAKSKGFDYAEHLQEKMGRPIQDDRDAKVGEKMLKKNAEAALLDLTRKRLGL